MQKGKGVTLLSMYLLQAYSYQDPEITYSYYLGPHFFLDLSLHFADGTILQRFNLVAIAIVLLLVIGLFPFDKPANQRGDRTPSRGRR